MDMTLLAACNDLLGLLVLLRNREDIPAEVKDIMETHQRVRDAKAAVVAALARELKPSVSFVDVANVTEYGLTQKLSNSVRVF